MRFLKPTLIVMILVLLASCNRQVIAPDSETALGYVTVSLDNNVTKAGGDDPDVDDFWIEIFNSKDIRLYSKSYADTKGKNIPLNAGDYKLLAKHGDTLGCGFNKAFYLAEQQFAVVGGNEPSTVAATAKLGNVKLAVNFGEKMPVYYSDGYYAIVRHETIRNKSVKFESKETRDGYIPAGSLILEVYAKIDGEWKYYAAPAQEYSPQDYVVYTIDVSDRTGGLTVNILVDDSTATVEKNIEIDATEISTDKPSVTTAGFDQDNNYSINALRVADGSVIPVQGLCISLKAPSGISRIAMKSTCSYLPTLPASVDFANVGSNAQVLEDNGFFWAIQSPNAVIDFSTVIPVLAEAAKTAAGGTQLGKFEIILDDVRGNSASTTVTISMGMIPSVTMSISDVFAKSALIPDYAVSGIPESSVAMEVSKDGTSWERKAVGTAYGKKAITGLDPDTDYIVRANYEGQIMSGPFSIHTEEAMQIGNSGFEDWTTLVHNFKNSSGNSKDIDWYQPFVSESDSWWAVNSKVSLPSRDMITAGSVTYNIRRFPCVAYSTAAASGSKSASLQVVAISGTMTSGNLASANYHIGELFIGKSNDDGSHLSDGHSFSSRPAALNFKYRYSAYKSSDNFQVYAYILLTDGTKVEVSKSGSASNEWATFTLPFSYTKANVKASQIYVSFKTVASASSSNVSASLLTHEIAGTEQQAKFGSELRIDDIELIYE